MGGSVKRSGFDPLQRLLLSALLLAVLFIGSTATCYGATLKTIPSTNLSVAYSNKLLLEILGAMGDMAEEMQRMDEAHRELQDYVESIDDDLSDLTETLFSDEEEDDEDADDADECDCEDCADDTDDEDDAAEEENPDDDLIAYACPNCGAELTFHANDVDFDENTLCPNCHQPIFPEIDEDSEEETEE